MAQQSNDPKPPDNPSDHYIVGQEHARARQPRYKFQTKHLQSEYDRGYDSIRQYRDEDVDVERKQQEEFERRILTRQQTGWRIR